MKINLAISCKCGSMSFILIENGSVECANCKDSGVMSWINIKEDEEQKWKYRSEVENLNSYPHN